MRIAAEHDVDLDQVQGTGRGGRVRKQDVLAFIEPAAQPPANGAAEAEPPLHIESPYRPEPPAPQAGRGPAAPAPAPAGRLRPPRSAPTSRRPAARSRACASSSAST